MKTIVTAFFLHLGIASPWAQNDEFRGIILQHTYKKFEIRIPEYKKVKIYFKNDSLKPIVGNFELVSKTSIRIDENIFNLGDISILRARNPVLPVTGGMLAGISGAVIGAAVFGGTPVTIMATAAVAPFTLVMGATVAFSRKTYLMHLDYKPIIFDGKIKDIPIASWIKNEVTESDSISKRFLMITNKGSGKSINIRENKTIRVYFTQSADNSGNIDRISLTGKLKVVDASTININGENIPLSTVYTIKTPYTFFKVDYNFTCKIDEPIQRSELVLDGKSIETKALPESGKIEPTSNENATQITVKPETDQNPWKKKKD